MIHLRYGGFSLLFRFGVILILKVDIISRYIIIRAFSKAQGKARGPPVFCARQGRPSAGRLASSCETCAAWERECSTRGRREACRAGREVEMGRDVVRGVPCAGSSSSGGCALAVLARAAGCSGALLRRVPLARAALRALASACWWLCVGLVRWLT